MTNTQINGTPQTGQELCDIIGFFFAHPVSEIGLREGVESESGPSLLANFRIIRMLAPSGSYSSCLLRSQNLLQNSG